MASFVKSKLKQAKDAIGKKDWASGETLSQEVLSYEADNYHANAFLGLASMELGKNEQSEQAYRKAIEIQPAQLLAWQGLCRLYERTEAWNDLAEALKKQMDIHAKAGDAAKCAEALQKYVELRREHGSSEQVFDALSLYLPDSPYYPVLSDLPPPDPTAPTATITSATQTAIQNSLPILEELLAIEEKRENTFIANEVGKRRMRLGAGPLSEVKLDVLREAAGSSKLPQLYNEIISHPQTTDEARRATEAKLLRYRYDLLLATPPTGKTSKQKAELWAQVEDMIQGAVLLKIPDELAWNTYIETRDHELLDQYDPAVFRDYLSLFPGAKLSNVIKGYLVYCGLPLKEKEGEEDEAPQVSEETDEDPFSLVFDAFPDNQSSLFAYRVMNMLNLDAEEHAQVRKFGEAGLSLIRKYEKDFGFPFKSTRKAFTVDIAIALVYLFPPKHHLRAAGLLDEVLDSDPDHINCLMAKGTIYQYAHKWREAEEIYARVQKLRYPEDVDAGLEAREQGAWCALQGGYNDEAVADLKEVVEILDGLDGKDYQKARAWWRLGKAHWDADGNLRDEAYSYWITSLKRLSTYAPAFTSLGLHYAEHASPPDPIRASKCFQKAFELDPREGEAARRLAEGFAEEKEWDLVEVVASRTISGEGGVTGGMDEDATFNKKQALPTNAWAWRAMGVVELGRRNYNEAIQAFQITLRANESDFQSWLRLGEAYVNGGRHVAGLKALDRALELKPDDWSAIFVKGDALKQTFQLGPAIEAFNAVLEQKPGDAGARLALSATYLELARTEHAAGYIARSEGSLRKAIELSLLVVSDAPGFRSTVWKTIGDALQDLSRRTSYHEPAAVTETFQLVLHAIGDDSILGALVPGRNALADAASQLGQGQVTGDIALAIGLGVAQTRLAVVEGDVDQTASASYDVAMLLSALAKGFDLDTREACVAKAVDLVKTAVRSNPGEASYWDALGILRFTGDVKLAQHSFIMAIEMDNKSPLSWTHLGMLYLTQDDADLANHAFYRAQVLDPDYSLAWIGQALVATRNEHIVEARALLEHAISLSAGVPEADFEFAARVFALYSANIGAPGTSSGILFLPFAVLDRFCQQRPDEAAALHLYGLICERLGQHDLGAQLIERAVAVLDAAYNQTEDPETERQYAIAQVNLGRLQLALSNYASAVEHLEVALSLLPAQPEDETVTVLRAHTSLCAGLAHYKAEDLATALTVLEAALEETPEELTQVHGHITIILAQTLWALETEEARDTAKNQLFAAITADSKNLDAITTLAAFGILNVDDDLLDAALSDIIGMPLDERHALDPGRAVEDLLISHHLSKGDTEEALSLLETGVQAEPSRSRAREDLAIMLLRLGRAEAARSVLNALLDSQDGTERSSLGEVLGLAALALAISNPTEMQAVKDAQRALFLNPGSARCRKILAFCRSQQ